MSASIAIIPHQSPLRVGLLCLTLFSVFLSPHLCSQESDSLSHRQHRIVNITEVHANQQPHDPKRALRLSAMLPGAGQVYNRQAWKVPIIYAAIGGVGYYTYYNYSHMRDYKDEYLYRVNHNDAVQNPEMANIPRTNIYNLYEAYNKSFQLSIIICAAVYGLNIVDAFVFAHLFDVQINDDISLHIMPSVTPLMGAPVIIYIILKGKA